MNVSIYNLFEHIYSKTSVYQLNGHHLNKKIFKSFLELCLLNCDMLRNLTENVVAYEIIDKYAFWVTQNQMTNYSENSQSDIM